MINGNIDEFVDKLWSGEELIYIHNGKKYFSQGYLLEGGNIALSYSNGNQKEKYSGM